MMHFVLVAGWGLALFGAFAGWGALIGRRLLRMPRFALGECVATGMAASIAAGGVLNLLALISPALVIGQALAGLAWLAIELPLGGWRADPSPGQARGRRAPAVVAALVALSVVRYGGAVQATSLNQLDDHTGYVVFPVRMLQAGEMGRDPFNVRRMESGLGGMSYLHAMLMALFPEANAPLVDRGVGYLALLAMAVALGRARSLAGPALLVLAASAATDRSEIVNITGVMTPLALLLALYVALGREGPWRARTALVALLGSAACSIKSSFLPITVIALALHYLVVFLRRRTIAEAAAAAGLSLAFLLPWMAAMRASSGTWLYPILGRGFHGTQYGTFQAPDADLSVARLIRNEYLGLVDPLAVVAFFAAALALVLARRGGRLRPEAIAFQLAPAINAALILRMFEAGDAFRYLAPTYRMSILISLSLLLGSLRGAADSGRRATLIGAICLVFAFDLGGGWTNLRVACQFDLARIRSGLRGGSYTDPAEASEALAMQAAIAPGEPIMVWATKPYLLDFRRNPLYILDWPGGSSPPPGLPFYQGAEPVARYLLGRGIRYLAYDRGVRAQYAPSVAAADSFPAWGKTVTLHALNLYDNVVELIRTRTHAYDSPRYVILDLAEPAAR